MTMGYRASQTNLTLTFILMTLTYDIDLCDLDPHDPKIASPF